MNEAFSRISVIKIILQINLAERKNRLPLHSRRKTEGNEEAKLFENILTKSKNKFGGYKKRLTFATPTKKAGSS